MDIQPPEYVNKVLSALASGGFTACIVGGCVRDLLLGVEPNDWDVASSALPEEVMEIFPGSVPTGIKHGTVTARVDGQSVEVTTFRTDGSYADHRHPDGVNFVKDLKEDLSRRDFTINAIAITAAGQIEDPFGGRADLEKGIIRAVGEAGRRFEEDALRMLRAFRFSSRLGFVIEENTLMAVKENAPLTVNLSAERVRDEIEKILMTERPEAFKELLDYGLISSYVKSADCPEKGLAAIKNLPREALLRWAGLCAALEKAQCIDSAENFLRALRLDLRTIRACSRCCAMLKGEEPGSKAGWKRALHAFGEDAARCAAAILGRSAELEAVLASGECYKICGLKISGDDLKKLGISGKEIGNTLEALLDKVIEDPKYNNPERLLHLAEKINA